MGTALTQEQLKIKASIKNIKYLRMWLHFPLMENIAQLTVSLKDVFFYKH